MMKKDLVLTEDEMKKIQDFVGCFALNEYVVGLSKTHKDFRNMYHLNHGSAKWFSELIPPTVYAKVKAGTEIDQLLYDIEQYVYF